MISIIGTEIIELWSFDFAREDSNIFLVQPQSSIFIELHRSYGLGCPSNLKGDMPKAIVHNN